MGTPTERRRQALPREAARTKIAQCQKRKERQSRQGDRHAAQGSRPGAESRGDAPDDRSRSPESAWGQQPASPGPASVPVAGIAQAPQKQEGPIRHAFRHAGRALQAGAIGYPKYFNEPPPGYYINVHYKRMSANANPHRFTVYRSDFLPGTNAFSPVGATRFNQMASRLAQWQGPVMIEWSTDEPGLAETRRAAVVGIFQQSAHAPNHARASES